MYEKVKVRLRVMSRSRSSTAVVTYNADDDGVDGAGANSGGAGSKDVELRPNPATRHEQSDDRDDKEQEEQQDRGNIAIGPAEANTVEYVLEETKSEAKLGDAGAGQPQHLQSSRRISEATMFENPMVTAATATNAAVDVRRRGSSFTL